MGLGGLQHYTIEPSDLERTKDFYCDVLGLENGDRPPLDFPGYWLYSGGTATVHLMGTRKPREGIVVRGTEKKYQDTGRLDHIAFAATDVDGVRKRLQSKGVKFRESIVPRTGDKSCEPKSCEPKSCLAFDVNSASPRAGRIRFVGPSRQ